MPRKTLEPVYRWLPGDDVRTFFGFKGWPDSQASVELDRRTWIVIPTPGHQEEAITIYDPQTKWLLTGDTLYPGYIYVKNWESRDLWQAPMNNQQLQDYKAATDGAVEDFTLHEMTHLA